MILGLAIFAIIILSFWILLGTSSRPQLLKAASVILILLGVLIACRACQQLK